MKSRAPGARSAAAGAASTPTPAGSLRRAVLSGLAVAAALGGCSRDQPAAPPANLVVPRPAEERLDLDALWTRELIEESAPRDLRLPGDWVSRGGRLGEAGYCLASDAPELRVEIPVTATRASASSVLADVTGLRRGFVELRVSRPGATEAVAERTVYWREAAGDEHDRFELQWRSGPPPETGQILSVRIPAEPGRTPCVNRISWFRRGLDPERIAALGGRPLRVEIDHEVRDSVAQPSAAPLELELGAAVARGSLAEISFGVAGGDFASASFTVESVSAAGAVTPLVVERVDGSTERRWVDRRFELDQSIPAGTRLRLQARLDPPLGREPTIPVWSDLRFRPARAGRRRPNIVLVSIDTLRADRMSTYGAARPTSPGLSAWAAARAAVFESAIAQAPATLPSHTSLFTGLQPFHHGVVQTLPAPASLRMLAERLRDAGYRTRAVTGAGFLDPRYGLDQGFESYRYWGERWQPEAELADGARRATEWIGSAPEEPFFLFFHTYEVHGPYRVRQPFLSRWRRDADPDLYILPEPSPARRAIGGDPPHHLVAYPRDRPQERAPLAADRYELARDLYDSGIAAADQAVSAFLDRLDRVGLAEHTLVVVTSDHGESLGEHGVAGHGFLYDDNLRVPLLVALPDGSAAGRRIAEQVELVDLAPTLLEIAGVAPEPAFEGESLLPLLRGESRGERREALSYSSALGLSIRVRNRSKLIVHDGLGADRDLRNRLFRIDRDPLELHNEFGARADRADLAAKALDLLRRSSGLHLTIAAAATSDERLVLDAPWLEAGRTSWLRNPCECIDFYPDGTLVVAAGPRAEATLLVRLASAPPEQLGIERHRQGRLVQSERVDLAALVSGARPDAIIIARTDPPAAGAPRSTTTLVELRWMGAGALAGGNIDPSTRDAELREQLEALGYLK